MRQCGGSSKIFITLEKALKSVMKMNGALKDR